MSDRTVRRWARETSFLAALLELRREQVGQALTLAQRYAPVAVNTLGRVVTDAAAPASSRVAASSNVLKFAVQGLELADLALRVEALEKARSAPAPRPAPPHHNGNGEEPEEEQV